VDIRRGGEAASLRVPGGLKKVADGQAQVSLTDPDARSMKNRDRGIVGYNVQAAVDAEHLCELSDALCFAATLVHFRCDSGQFT
jgi:hypothetical protein